jgi:tRNA(fMet)-specific endonuclease VapC
MNGNYLLDTNAVIALYAQDSAIESLVATSTDVFLPVVAIGEMVYGAEKSMRVVDNLKRVEEIAAKHTILPCDTDTARLFGRIKQQLRAKGKPIPDHDSWIAALALQHHLTLVTRDSHFNEVTDLNLQTW